MNLRQVLSILHAVLLAGALAPIAIAAQPDAAGKGTFFAGVDADNQDSRRFSLGLALNSSGGTSIDLLAARSETDSDSLDLSSTYAFGQLGHDFGVFGIAAGVRHMRDEGLHKTLGWLGSAFVDFSDSRLMASVESRNTDFDDVNFTTSGEELGLEGVTSATGTAGCSVGSLGYGLRLDVVRHKWSVYTSANLFEYSSHQCNTTVTGTTSGTGPGPIVPGPIQVRRPPIVSQFVSNVGGGFAGYSATLMPREGALLESSLMGGASFALGDRSTLGFELYRDSEEFAQAETNTALAFVVYRASRKVGLTLNVGATDSDVWDSSVFAGVRISTSFGR